MLAGRRDELEAVLQQVRSVKPGGRCRELRKGKQTGVALATTSVTPPAMPSG